MKREDSAFIKEEMLRRQGVSPDQLKANGKILSCTFPGSLSSQFDELHNIGYRAAIWRIARKYVLIDGKIVDPKARTNESAESWAIAPKVVGSLVNDNGIYKPKFIEPTNVAWEFNVSTGDTFVAVDSDKVFRAKCELVAYVPEK